MPDRRFYAKPIPILLGDILEGLAALHSSLTIYDVSELAAMQPGTVGFCTSKPYVQALQTKLTELLATPKQEDEAPSSPPAVILISGNLVDGNAAWITEAIPYGFHIVAVPDARRAFMEVALALYPHPITDTPGFAVAGDRDLLPACAQIAPTAIIEDGVTLGTNCVVDHYTIIRRGCVIGDNVSIGPSCFLERAIIGDNVLFASDVSVGLRGYGFMHNHALEPSEPNHITHFPHLGRVLIGNNCYLARLVQIARGTLGDTVIGHAVMIGNGSKLTHNVQVGDGTMFIGHNGVAGSTKIGRNCILGGKAALGPHMTITDGVILTGGSVAYKDINEAGEYMGEPAMPKRLAIRDHFLRLRAASGR
ncbi:MAG: hypothetical protein K0U36_03345 [Alphaproteobacteria bacterium]|nr:hypothetical protein [Alphaproteobacteria bacterium]